ncbi:MAG: hypothetical protein JRG89_08630 [Deltaproteobacteria bacterium]|nr:hypothetical protein [Deltaproteobacteria bacterium]MBW2388490.1 hypothetical protein [Deltaproteobacteria bacterium]
MASPAKNWIARFMLLCVATVIGLGLCEFVLRMMSPGETFGTAQELPWLRGMDAPDAAQFEISPEFGFLPVMGTEVRGPYGTLANDYALAKTPGRTRLLFLGDSVTSRGRIVRAIEAIYRDSRYEYWNAGVESYNTVQEVVFYEAFNAQIEPDHVILTFHLNDYETTPVVTRNADGNMVVYRLNRPARQINRTLFVNSQLYRAVISLGRSRQADATAIAREVDASLRELAELLQRDDIKFSVIVLPFMSPDSEWNPGLVSRRKRILKFLRANQIRFFDLLPPLRLAIKQGVDVQERPGDAWHPSDAVSQYFARHLYDQGLLSAQ